MEETDNTKVNINLLKQNESQAKEIEELKGESKDRLDAYNYINECYHDLDKENTKLKELCKLNSSMLDKCKEFLGDEFFKQLLNK